MNNLLILIYTILYEIRIFHWKSKGLDNLVAHEFYGEIYKKLDQYLDEFIEIQQLDVNEVPLVKIETVLTSDYINDRLGNLVLALDVPESLSDWKGRLTNDIGIWRFKLKPKNYKLQ